MVVLLIGLHQVRGGDGLMHIHILCYFLNGIFLTFYVKTNKSLIQFNLLIRINGRNKLIVLLKYFYLKISIENFQEEENIL